MSYKMEINLTKRPHNPTIIEGFPGFGLIGSIATEFLIEHCNCEQIGAHWFEKLPATLAVHEGKIIKPLNIYYNENKNLVIIHAISGGHGLEWEISDFILDLAKQLEAKEIISLEGVGSAQAEGETKVYYVTSDESKKEHIHKQGVEELKEGILIGVTSALLMKSDIPITAFFAETHSELPDSKAAAKIVEKLNGYIGLDIDSKPLLEEAEKFEKKLNKILQKGADVQDQMKKKQLSYVG
jgi:uncharacterized protein